ncbi:hypothetical protein [Dinghuibacter silviterrae]|uniref:hypothetical protein n=1 Tax=Dinghuibacter silviterrae TaxID=1539049 RepID=UPI0010636A78|nr:hypothetical protein [Dinghuibacter silviterrae]
MKKTKILLVSLCLLASGIGIAATKSKAKTSFTYYFEMTVGSPSTCATVIFAQDPVCSTTTTVACNMTVVGVGTRQLFLSEDGKGNCITPLYLR